MLKETSGKPSAIDEEDVIDQPEDINVPDETLPEDKKVIDIDEEEATAKDFKNIDQKAFAAMRKEATEAKRERDALSKRIQEYEKNRNTPAPQVAPPINNINPNREVIGGIPVPETKEEWDALARRDWQAAVDLRSIISARKVRDEHVKTERATQALNESKEKVIQKHPELNDINTEKSKIFLNILDRNPEYLTMSKGPILAMRDMEDEMEALGYSKEQIFETKKIANVNEATRINRGALTSGGRMVEKSNGRTVQLSKDDLEFCKNMGLDPVDYAKERLNREGKSKGAQL
jgi:hypothetical protein